MKKIPRILIRVTVSNGKHDRRMYYINPKSCRKPYGSSMEGEGKERESRSAKKKIKKDTYPCLLLSMSRGATARMYVQVQMSRRMTSKRDWKLKSAD